MHVYLGNIFLNYEINFYVLIEDIDKEMRVLVPFQLN